MQRQILNLTRLPGLLYTPDDLSAADSWPLLVFLHGSGERGTDLVLAEKHGSPKFIRQGLELPFIVYVPQCPLEKRWIDVEDAFFRDLDQVIWSQDVDLSQIYLTGFSMGGQGTWYFAACQPQRFAAIAPVAGRIPPEGNFLQHLADLALLPTWIVHSSGDEAVEVEDSDQMNKRLQEQSAPNLRYSRYEDLDHGETSDRIYQDGVFYDWFLQWCIDEQETTSKADLLQKVNAGWENLQAFLASLSEADYTANTDPAGWTAKDHLAHLAVWEDGVVALLHKQSRTERMGLDMETFMSRDYDRMNEVIRQQHVEKTPAQVLDYLRRVHQNMLDTLDSFSDEDLNRPYSHYGTGASSDAPIFRWIAGDTYLHYGKHQTYIERIVSATKTES